MLLKWVNIIVVICDFSVLLSVEKIMISLVIVVCEGLGSEFSVIELIIG